MHFTLPIDIVPQGRPRFYNGIAYDPPKSRQFKKDLALIANSLVSSAFSGEVKVKLDIYRQRSKFKKGVTSKKYGDIDNLAKAVLDALNGICWRRYPICTLQKILPTRHTLILRLRKLKMIDLDNLKTFAQLPHIFTAKLYREILETIQTYDGYKAYIVSELERYGEDAYKNPDAYTEVKYDVLNLKLPAETERRLLAIIEQMREEYTIDDKA